MISNVLPTLAAVGIAAAGVPIGFAAGAKSATDAPSAVSSTTRGLCTVTPLTPVFAGFDSAGDKQVDYQTKLSCTTGRKVVVTDRQYDRLASGDVLIGRDTRVRIYPGGSTTIHLVHTLPNKDPAREHVYHKVSFVVSACGVTSVPTNYESSAILSIAN